MKGRLRRSVAVVLLWAISGCTAVRPVMAPAPFISDKHPRVVYVVDKDGRLFTIAEPRLQGDSVVGVSAQLDHAVGLPLDRVQQVQASQVSRARTVVLVTVLGAGAIGLAYFAAHAGGGQSCNNATFDPKFFNQGDAGLCTDTTAAKP